MHYSNLKTTIGSYEVNFHIKSKDKNFDISKHISKFKIHKKGRNVIIWMETAEKYLEYISTNCERIEIASHNLEKHSFCELDWHVAIELNLKIERLSCNPVVTALKHEYYVAFMPLDDVICEELVKS